MDNLAIYNAVCAVPPEAIKPIQGGKLKGKSDINPMWRIKKLTEQFGPCGIGWGYMIDRMWTEPGAGGEVAAFVQISLWYIQDGKRSEAVPGIGGSALISRERGELATSDECYKMALTDAISVAAKALGVAGNVYWDKDPTKYAAQGQPDKAPEPIVCTVCGREIRPLRLRDGTEVSAADRAKKSRELYGSVMCVECAKRIDEVMAK